MKLKLEEIADLSLGKSLSRISKKYTGEKATRNVLYHRKQDLFIEEDEVAKDSDLLSIAENGDIILKMSEPQTAIKVSEESMIKEGTVIPSQFTILKMKNENVDEDFLIYLLNSKSFENQLKKINQGIIKRIKITDLNKLELDIPTIEKQKDIVKYLKLIDEEIEWEKKLIKEKENLKEGLIQELSNS